MPEPRIYRAKNMAKLRTTGKAGQGDARPYPAVSTLFFLQRLSAHATTIGVVDRCAHDFRIVHLTQDFDLYG